jgi:hypothetical protein
MNLCSVTVPNISWHTLYPVQAQWMISSVRTLKLLTNKHNAEVLLWNWCSHCPPHCHLSLAGTYREAYKIFWCQCVFVSSTQTTYPGHNVDFITWTRLGGMYSLLFETWFCIHDSERNAYRGLAGAFLEGRRIWEFYVIVSAIRADCVCGMRMKLADNGVWWRGLL